MSSSLFWEKLPKEPKRNNVGSLKWILIERFGGEDSFPKEIDGDIIQFLEGVRLGSGDDDVKSDAYLLISAIEDNGSVLLTLRS
jgi:hypothetical protein